MEEVSWPVATLDFEASGTGRSSYPIEVGFARWRGLDAPIESWSTLIRPDLEWSEDGYWSEAAAAVHKIARGDLASGLSPDLACQRLSVELAGCTVCCDGYAYDRVWLSQLYEAGGVGPGFQLEPMSALYHLAGPGLLKWLRVNRPVPHRACADAERLMRAFAYGLKRRPRRVALP